MRWEKKKDGPCNLCCNTAPSSTLQKDTGNKQNRNTPAKTHTPSNSTVKNRQVSTITSSQRGTPTSTPSLTKRRVTPHHQPPAPLLASTTAHLRVNDARASALGTGTGVKLIAATKVHGTPSTSCEVADDAGTAKKTADNAATAATGAGGTTTTPAAEDLLSHSSREVPLGEVSLLGVSHVLITVSTMELFFRRFDMLEQQLDELKSLMSKSPDSRSVYPILNGGAAVDVANLTARVSALEGVHANRSGVLDETSTNTRLLLNATEGLKDDLRKVHGEIESVHGACRAVESKLESKLEFKSGSGPSQHIVTNVVKSSLPNRSKSCLPVNGSNNNHV